MTVTHARTVPIGINVTDLDRSVDFHAAALGLVVGRSDDVERRGAFLGHAPSGGAPTWGFLR
jgi:hypothetical protein